MNTKNSLLGILILFVFAVGFLLGRFSSAGDTYVSDLSDLETSTIENTESAPSISGTSSTSPEVAEEEVTTIQASSLTAGQKKLLGVLGIDADSIVVTPLMTTCAEASLGPTRMEEIIAGATPSIIEGLKLAACYK